MVLTPDFSVRPETRVGTDVSHPITELLCGDARELIAAAVEVKVQAGPTKVRRDGVENRSLLERCVTTSVGGLPVELARIRTRHGESANLALAKISAYLI